MSHYFGSVASLLQTGWWQKLAPGRALFYIQNEETT